MNFRLLFFVTALFAANFPASAYAHWGHVGDLAGHAHVLGIGALAAAAALAAALARGKEAKSDETQTSEDDAATEARGEAA